jgi:hypothetical protein
MMNYILKDILDKGVLVNIDNIFLNPTNEKIHTELFKELVERLAKTDFVISLEKCVWRDNDVESSHLS